MSSLTIYVMINSLKVLKYVYDKFFYFILFFNFLTLQYCIGLTIWLHTLLSRELGAQCQVVLRKSKKILVVQTATPRSSLFRGRWGEMDWGGAGKVQPVIGVSEESKVGSHFEVTEGWVGLCLMGVGKGRFKGERFLQKTECVSFGWCR